MKKGMSGRTKKRLSKNRKVGGNIPQALIGGLLFVFLLIGIMRSEYNLEAARNQVNVVKDVLKDFYRDPTLMNEAYMEFKDSNLSPKDKDLLIKAFNLEQLWKKSMSNDEEKKLQDLYGPATTYVEADPEKMNKIIKILENLNLFKTMSEKNKNDALKKALMEELKKVTAEKSRGQSAAVTTRTTRKSRTSRTSGIKRGTSA
jgi:hypothetical protein